MILSPEEQFEILKERAWDLVNALREDTTHDTSFDVYEAQERLEAWLERLILR